MTTGVLPFDDLKKKCHLNTGFFETSQYTEDEQMYVTSGNHDKAGLSIGNLQYNWGPADRAQEWFLYMINNHRALVDSAFGANTVQRDEFITTVTTKTRTERIAWGDSISALVGGEKRALISPYKEAFGTLLTSPEGKAKYYDMKDVYYWNPSYELFRHLPCVSRISLASLFDTYVNKGRYYPVNLIVADFDRIDADTTIDATEKERQKNYAINWRGNYDNAVNPNNGGATWDSDQVVFWHGDGVDDGRRGCMANQVGTYYQAPYDSNANFDMNNEPATDEKVGSSPIDINLGDFDVNDVYVGNTPVSKLYLGATLIGGGEVAPYTSSRVPKTQFRTNEGSYAGISNQTAVTIDAGKPLWIDCQEPFVGCRTYYTTDGTEPTEASTLYTDALTFSANTTLKVKTISVFGVAEATKTLAVTVTGTGAGVTTISPSSVTQNTIPFTVTLTNSAGATMYYRIGAGTQQTYTGPFEVSQSTNDVGVNIPVTYWSTGEAERTITYNTSGAIPATPVVEVIPGNWYVRVNWTATANTTSYSVYRSTVAGQLGELISAPYQLTVGFDDNTPVNGTTYYYTVRSANYGTHVDSAQVSATPTSGEPVYTSFRYLKIEGYGSVEEPTTTRLIEFEAWVGSTNAMTGALSLSAQAISTGSPVETIYDGVKTTSGYPIWWSSPTPNANIIIDFLTPKAFTKLNYYSYSVSWAQRANRFRVLASNTNDGTDWVILWDMANNTDPQPLLPLGYEKLL